MLVKAYFPAILGLISTLQVTVLAAPALRDLVVRDLTIPFPPADPPAPATGDGAGPYNSKTPTIGDRLKKAAFYTAAVAAQGVGFSNMGRNMQHYLDNTGDTLYENVEEMMSDMPQFRTTAKSVVQNAATNALRSISGASGEKTFTSTWSSFYATESISRDWYFALGGFSVATTGVVTKSTSGNTLRYKIHVFDRYNWDAGKHVTVPGTSIEIKDTELAELHLTGLAREYLVRGSSAENRVADFREGIVPLPDVGGRG